MNQFQNLFAFSKWFLSQSLSSLRPPHNAVYFYQTEGGVVTSVVLCRVGQFQVELFVGPGPGHFPEHAHPNVDSIEMHLTGEIAFTIRGRQVIPPDRIKEIASDGASVFCGFRSRVGAGVPHGANVGPGGGAFLSIQQWRDGLQPTSVGLDWVGPPHVSARHV